MPKITALIIIEPFFGEFVPWPWKKIALITNRGIVHLMRWTDRLGLKRTKFPEVNYNIVEKQPLFFQPFYDIAHQSMTDYFEKIEDILTFELPQSIETKTYFIFSPKGFIRDPKKRDRLKSIFVNSDLVEIGKNTHNIMTLSYEEIGKALREWLRKYLSL